MKQELKNAFGKVFLTVTVDSENRWVHNNWIGYLTKDNVQAGALAYTNAVREAGYNCVLNDTSEVLGSWDHSLDWVLNEWAPEAARAGITHLAMITNPETFAESSAAAFFSNLRNFEVKMFDNIIYAQNWLRLYATANRR